LGPGSKTGSGNWAPAGTKTGETGENWAPAETKTEETGKIGLLLKLELVSFLKTANWPSPTETGVGSLSIVGWFWIPIGVFFFCLFAGFSERQAVFSKSLVNTF
jgi:hypothetical protein